MPILVKPNNTKYVMSNIDNKEYCKTSGHFAKHLRNHNLSEEEYVVKYEGGHTPICHICNKNLKFLPNLWVWESSCQDRKCKNSKIKNFWLSRSDEEKKIFGKKAKEWRSDKEKEAKVIAKVHEANLRIGDDGLTGYQRTAQKREQILLERTGHKYVTNTWGKISEEKKKAQGTLLSDKMMNKYGVKNPSQIPSVKDKIKQTNAQPEQRARRKQAASDLNARIAADPIWSASVVEKRSKTMIDRYGTANLLTLLGKVSKISLELFDGIFKVLNDGQYHNNGGELRIGKSFVDFAYKNKIIEFNGDFWHANPKKYSSTDILKYAKNRSKPVSEIWERDKQRLKNIEDQGYKIKVVWESEFRENKEQVIKESVQWLMN